MIRVPPVTEKTAQLLEPLTSEDPFAAIFADDVETFRSLATAPRAIPKGVKIALYAVVTLVLTAAILVGLLVLICSDGACRDL